MTLAEPTCATTAAAAGGGLFGKPSKTHPRGAFSTPTAALLLFIMSPLVSTANEPYTLHHGTGRAPCLWHAACFLSKGFFFLYVCLYPVVQLSVVDVSRWSSACTELPAALKLMPQLLCQLACVS